MSYELEVQKNLVGSSNMPQSPEFAFQPLSLPCTWYRIGALAGSSLTFHVGRTVISDVLVRWVCITTHRLGVLGCTVSIIHIITGERVMKKLRNRDKREEAVVKSPVKEYLCITG